MSDIDDGSDDDLGKLLQNGYASQVDPEFAASLLARLQGERVSRPRRWVGLRAAAAAAALAVACGVALILHFWPSPAPQPIAQGIPFSEPAPIVVVGRMMKWEEPIAEFAISRVIRGKLEARRITVDLTPMSEASHVDPAGQATSLSLARGPRNSLSVLLSETAGKECVLELHAVRPGAGETMKAAILSWEGITNLPPRDRGANEEDVNLTVVINSSKQGDPAVNSRWLSDEWGMPR